MQIIQSQEELVDVLQKITKKSKLSIAFPPGIKKQLMNSVEKLTGIKNRHQHQEGYSFIHKTINYKGEQIQVKIPNLFTYLSFLARKAEMNSFDIPRIGNVSPREGIRRENEIYAFLNKQGFPTFESKQHLIPTDSDGNPAVEDIGLTRRVLSEEAKLPTKTMRSQDKNASLEYIAKVTQLMNELHQKYNIIWIDPALGNTLKRTNGDPILYDFSINPSDKVSLEEQKAGDLIHLCLESTQYPKGAYQKKIIQTIMHTYDTKPISNALNTALTAYIRRNPSKLTRTLEEASYTKPYFGKNVEEVKKAKKEILKHLN